VISSNTYPAGTVINIDENGDVNVETPFSTIVTNPDTNTTTLADGTVIVENNSTTPKIKLIVSPEGDTNSTVSNGNKNSSVNMGDVNKTITINEDNETITSLDDFNTTITQKADGSVDINKTEPSKKDIGSDLNSTTVTVDDNGTTTLKGSAGDNNITVVLEANGELNSTIESPNGKSELSVNGELNANTTIEENGDITTIIENPNTTIKQTGLPSIELNTTTPNGDDVYINLQGDNTTTVDQDGKIVIDTDKETVTINPNGKIEVETDAGGYIKIPNENGDTNITTNSNGNTVIENVDANGFKTKITINSDGTMLIETWKADGTLIESKTYPAKTDLVLGDPVEIYYQNEDGEWIYIEISSNGVITITNGDGSTTYSEKKTDGNGDVTTDVTISENITGDVTQNSDGSTSIAIDEGDYSYDINITDEGGLNINSQGSEGTHDISVANPGADIDVALNGDLVITTPEITNTDGSTCGYQMDIAYDGSDMITKHYFDKGLSSETITTVIMKIPNASMDVTEDNQVIHFGQFVNTNTDDVNVTASIDCSGNVKTITKIQDQNFSYVAINKPGSTVVIEIDGGVDALLPLQVTPSNNIKQLKFSVDPNSGDITTQKVFSDDNVSEVVYPVGAKVVANNTNIAEVVVDLSNANIVKVAVQDENNNTVITTTTFDSGLGQPTRTSSGEDGKITNEVTVGGTTIVVDNFLDGKSKHIVTVGTTSTEAISNLEGADVNVTSSGVTTTYEDTTNSIKVEVKASTDGKAEHKIETTIAGEKVETKATSNILGAKTTIDKDTNGKAKVVTKVSTTNTSSQAVDIEVDASSDGSAIHKVVVNGVETKATSQIAGAITTIKIDGEVETNTTKDGNSLNAKANPDGTASHQLTLPDGKKSTAISNIKGAQTSIKTSNEIETVATLNDKNATIITDANGENSITLVTSNDYYITPIFEVDSNITIDQNNGEIEVIVVSPLTQSLQF